MGKALSLGEMLPIKSCCHSKDTKERNVSVKEILILGLNRVLWWVLGNGNNKIPSLNSQISRANIQKFTHSLNSLLAHLAKRDATHYL